MVEPAQFSAHVRDVVAHLDDRVHLASHPLVELLPGPARPASPDELHRLILDAIGQLRPPGGRGGTLAWRRWRAAHLRYVDRLSTKQVARRLQVSERQVLRDLGAAVEAVADVLRQRPASAGGGSWSLEAGSGRARPLWPERAEGPERPVGETDLEMELRRVAASDPGATADVAATITRALEIVRGLARSHAATFDLELPDGLPPVAAHPVVLRQLVLCLLSAAVEGEPVPRIAIAATSRAGTVQVDLATRAGEGLSPVSAPDRSEAAALIATAERLAGMLGGAVRAETTGECIRHLALTLPATRAPTLLVVDDNPDMGELFRWYLADLDVRVVQARSAATALELARELRPEAITLDVMMPSQDGWQLLEQLRADPAIAEIPTVVCSVLPERALALSLGVAGFLAKPVTQQDLLTALSRYLRLEERAARRDSPADSASSHRR